MPMYLETLGILICFASHRKEISLTFPKPYHCPQKVVDLTPEGHPEMHGHLNNLGNSHMLRFTRTKDLLDISKAISSLQNAVHLTPPGHADMPIYLTTLGSSFGYRFQHTGDLADISKAISEQQEAVHLTPQGHADMPNRLTNLGHLFRHRFKSTGDLADIDTAISDYSLAATYSSGPPSKRLDVAIVWTKWSQKYAPSVIRCIQDCYSTCFLTCGFGTNYTGASYKSPRYF